MYDENDGRCVECQCGCHAKSHANLARATDNLKEFGIKGLEWGFYAFLIYCLFGGLSR